MPCTMTTAVRISAWRNKDEANMIRTRGAQEAGAEVLDVCELELALAHLGVSEIA
jgi:hypothetical protein